MDMSLLGIIVALVVLIIICYRKFNPVVGTLICGKRLNFRYDRKNPRLLSSSRSTLTIHI